ncbi:hypothetical protein P2318_15895 [Myxococcaceae bacterium GXIMD 01537]
MTEFLDAILAFPTVFFTILLGVTLTYWLCVIAGAVGIDVLDGDVDLAAGAKAASGALEGGAKAMGGVLEGGAKAAAGSLEGGAKALGGHAADAGDAAGLLAWLGFAGVPVTVSASFVLFFSWTLSLLTAGPIHSALAGLVPSFLVSGVVGLGSFVLGTLGASVLVRPMRPLFVAAHAPGREALMGRLCTIASGSVTDKFGQATIEDGGAGLILNVFCAKANELKRGEQALILAYDAARDVYEIEPVDWLLPEETQQLGDPAKAAALARARGRVR